MTVLDDKTAQILGRWLDDSRWHPSEEEYPGDPEIHHEHQWRILQTFLEQDLDEGDGKEIHRAERVEPLEALAVARLLVDGLRGGYWYLVLQARIAGASWADVGKALGVSRQSAWEMYDKDVAAYGEKMKGRVGADFFNRTRAEYESVLTEPTTEQ